MRVENLDIMKSFLDSNFKQDTVAIPTTIIQDKKTAKTQLIESLMFKPPNHLNSWCEHDV